MDYLTNLFLTSVRPLGLIAVLVAVTYLLPLFLHRGSGNPAYKTLAKWRWKVALVLVLVVLVAKATSPTITPQNVTQGPTVTVPVDIPSQEIVSRIKPPERTDEELKENFDEITDWRNRNGTRPADQ